MIGKIDHIPPSRQTAIVIQKDGKIGVSNDIAIPTLDEDAVLVSVKAVAINPCDFKMPTKYPTPGAVVGCDFAGEIIRVGSDVSPDRYQIGDRVCGAVHGSNPANLLSGGFAEYITATADILLKVPNDVSWTEAAAFGGVSIGTLALAMWDYSLRLPGTPERPSIKPLPVLVYGGSTATGTMALQLLKLCGFRPITTCSPKNFDLVKSYGAEAAFDYHSPTCAEDIRKYTKGSLKYVLDVITEARTVELCYAAMSRLGGRYTGLEKLPLNCDSRRTVSASWMLGICIFGKEIALDDGYERPANREYRETGRDFFQVVQRLWGEGKLRPHPIKVLPGGWEGILEGIEMKRENRVSGEKLVVVLPEKQ